MAHPIADWAAELLSTQDMILEPVKKLWVMWRVKTEDLDTTLEQFADLLEKDGRFAFEEGVDHGAEDPEEEALMEELGFFSGPRVKLAAREITLDDIARMLGRSTTAMMDALRGAYETRPSGDQEAETMLLEALAAGDKLKRGIEEALEEARKRQETESDQDAGKSEED